MSRLPSPASAPDRFRRERRLVASIAILLLLFRSAPFLVWEQVLFESDEAVFGLMAQHIAQGRAFPLFMYGQTYLLAVESWLAAPVFLVFGSSVLALRVPTFAVNVAITLLLLRQLERDAGLRPALALVPALFFVLAPPVAAGHLLQAHGASLGPLLWVPLLWVVRLRPNLAGAVLAVGVLHREFTAFGLVALLAVELAQGTLVSRAGARRWFEMLRTAAFVWLLAQWLRTLAPAMGPDTRFEWRLAGHASPFELAERFCFEWEAVSYGLWRLVTDHWPTIFGVRVEALDDYGFATAAWQGLPGAWILLAGSMLLAVLVVAVRLLRERRWRAEYSFCAYLFATAVLSVAAYIFGTCGALDRMRYELLSLLGAAGLAAWFLVATPPRAVRWAWLAITAAALLVGTLGTGRLLADFIASPPPAEKHLIAKELEARGVRYASADYWLAYALTFLTRERVIVASEDLVRIEEYQRIVAAHRTESRRVSRHGCDQGHPIRGGVFLCPPR